MALATASTVAHAGDLTARDGAGQGTLSAMPADVAWAEPLSNGEMDELRGAGFFGMRLDFFTSIDDVTGLPQDFSVVALDPVGSFGFNMPAGFNFTTDEILGNSFVSSNGFFQVGFIEGNNNILNQNMFINITILQNPSATVNLNGF